MSITRKISMGQITIAAGTVVGIVTTVVAITASYFTTLNVQDGKAAIIKEELSNQVADVKDNLAEQISLQNERSARLEEAINTLKDNNKVMQSDIKAILQKVYQK